MRCGLSHTLIEYCEAPATEASPTPGTRDIASVTVVVTKFVIASASRLSSGE